MMHLCNYPGKYLGKYLGESGPTHQPHLMAVTIVSMVHLTQGKGIGKVLVATAKINIRNDHPLHTERGNYDQNTIFHRGPISCP